MNVVHFVVPRVFPTARMGAQTMNYQRTKLTSAFTGIVADIYQGASDAPVAGGKGDISRGSSLCEGLSLFFINRLNKHSFILVTCICLLGACASKQGLPSEELIPEDKERISRLIQGRDLNIGVVALGPKDSMGQDWSDFDPAFRQWVNQGPEVVDLGQWTVGLKRYDFGDAVNKSFRIVPKLVRNSGRAAPFALAVGGSIATINTIILSTIGEIRIEKTKPVTRTLSSVPALAGRITNGTLDKKTISEKITHQISILGRQRTRHRFRSVPFHLARHRRPREMGFDAYLTVQVQSVTLNRKGRDDPEPSLQLHVWTNFIWTNFMGTVGRPWTQTTPPLRLGSGSELASEYWKEELHKAVSTLGSKIVDLHFVP